MHNVLISAIIWRKMLVCCESDMRASSVCGSFHMRLLIGDLICLNVCKIFCPFSFCAIECVCVRELQAYYIYITKVINLIRFLCVRFLDKLLTSRHGMCNFAQKNIRHPRSHTSVYAYFFFARVKSAYVLLLFEPY